jgi:hypothetical protein
MSYQNLIQQIAPEANPRHVEAWLRIEHGTLDHLSRPRFEREVAIALACIAEAGPGGYNRLRNKDRALRKSPDPRARGAT